MKIKVRFFDAGDFNEFVGEITRHHKGGFICNIDKIIEIDSIPYDSVSVYPIYGNLFDIVNWPDRAIKVTLYVYNGIEEVELVSCKCRLEGVFDVKSGAEGVLEDRRKTRHRNFC